MHPSGSLGGVTGDDGVFDERAARGYDAHHAARFSPEVLEPTVAFLADLVGDHAHGHPVDRPVGWPVECLGAHPAGEAARGRALELAIGTGRVALPLAERGIEVVGIERSRAMVAQMAAKPGAERIPVTIGDMATTSVDGTFSLVYLVYSTIGNLLTQDEQVACFVNAAAHLEPGGRFVVEAGIPPLRRLPPGETLVAFDASEGHLGVDVVNVVDQTLVSHHAWAGPAGTELFLSPHRYAYPAEYDLMARIAGLALEERWGDWDRSPFGADSTTHISVWRKPLGEGPDRF
jgi:SAM-dependent methyltransferase